MKTTIKNLFLTGLGAILLSACTTIRPDQVGVKQRFGKIEETVREPGMVTYNPFTTQIVRVFVRTKSITINETLPSREGLSIRSESSILYSIRASEVPKILKETGLNYERDLILPVYRSAAADICSQYDAKDMHSSKRAKIEFAIQERMSEILGKRGFVIESVLLKNIELPRRISESIERKLEAEQDALRMQFVAEQERREVERQIIQEEGERDRAKIRAEGQRMAAVIAAEGKREAAIIEAQAKAESLELEAVARKNYNDLINTTLTPSLLKLKQIEAFEGLSNSPNSKLMLLDTDTPIMNMFGRD